MIPRIAKRGFSFKGAGKYYLHDKGKDTKERVAWTHTHNIPTDDPELAMKWMAYTAINNENLKAQAGIVPTGRKSSNQPVYSFSLAWQPEQEPEKEHMLELAFDALDLLGLKDHESVFVAHNDTDHPHVHVITNLVHPQNGKTLRPQNDRLKFSAWAESYEKENGKIYCEQRVINNEKRRNGEKTKHREVKVDHALVIQNLYNQSDSSMAFQAALETEGYTLAKGDRRGYVLVNQDGKILSLSRQLKGQRAKDIKERLADLEDLPEAKTIQQERLDSLRQQQEEQQQRQITHDLIKTEEKKKTEENSKNQIIKQGISDEDYQDRLKKLKDKMDTSKPIQPTTLADTLDNQRAKETAKEKASLKKEQELRAYYNCEQYQKKVDDLKTALEKRQPSKEKQRLQNELNTVQKTLDDIDKRMREQGIDPVDPSKKDYSKPSSKKDTSPIQKEELSPDQLREQKREEFRQQELKKMNKDKDKGQDLDFEL